MTAEHVDAVCRTIAAGRECSFYIGGTYVDVDNDFVDGDLTDVVEAVLEAVRPAVRDYLVDTAADACDHDGTCECSRARLLRQFGLTEETL